ncbi:MAG: CYTH and CHAD domain-containing protein [Actinomycetota bacterium]|nr:CYTH and CHAD domain-containing protein [Actinomycetota bacterium]
MVGDHLEREAKFEAGVGVIIPPLEDVWPGTQVAIRSVARLSAFYLDTADLRLMRNGITLRYRHEQQAELPAVSEWTLKLAHGRGAPKAAKANDGTGASMLVRRELTWPGSAQSVPSGADTLVRAVRRRQPLVPVARLVTRRRTIELLDPAGVKRAEVDDDLVSVMEGRRLAARFREIEVELGQSAPDGLLEAVAALLMSAGAVPSDGRSKVVRALGARASEPPDVRPMTIGDDAALGQVVQAAIAEGYLRLVTHDPGVRLDEDPEDVHQARVATRRLRSDLRTFRSLLDPGWLADARAELGWVAAVLGEVRDADVLTERLRNHLSTLDGDDARSGGALLARQVGERHEALGRLLTALDSDRYLELVETLAEAAMDPPWAHRDQPTADDDIAQAEWAKSAAEVAPTLVLGPWRHMVKAVDELGDDPSDEALHQVRIRAKRLRYACEAVVKVADLRAGELAKAAARLQGVLGDFHDAVVAEAWIRGAGAQGSVPEALVAGQLIGLERRAAQLGRDNWHGAWKALAKKRLHKWMK